MKFLVKCAQEVEQAVATQMSEVDKEKTYHLLQHRWHNLMDWCATIFTDPKGRAMAIQWGQFAQKWENLAKEGKTSSVTQTELQDQIRLCETARKLARMIGRKDATGKRVPCSEKAFGDQSTTYKEKGYFLNVPIDRQEVARLQNKMSQIREILNKYGFSEESKVIESVEDSLQADTATQGLTSDKMVQNLAEKGWVFNADDGEEIVEEDS